MPPGLGEVAGEEEVLPRGGLESEAPGSCELDPAVWLCMRTEHLEGEAGVWGWGWAGWRGKRQEWQVSGLKGDVKASPESPFSLCKHTV